MPTPTKTAKTKTAKTTKTQDSAKTLNQILREKILETPDTRVYQPLDLSVVKSLVMDFDKKKLEELVKSGQAGSIEIDVLQAGDEAAIKFLREYIKANGRNRDSKATHYGYLAQNFRENFEPDGTHWVVDCNGMVSDGGHSAKAMLVAFFPETAQYGLQGVPYLESVVELDEESGKKTTHKIAVESDSERGQELIESGKGWYYDHDGTVFATKLLQGNTVDLPLCGKYTEDGNYIDGSDSPEFRKGANLKVVLRINGKAEHSLKLADVRLEADYQDYLEMLPPIREYIVSKIPAILQKEMGSLCKTWYLRVNHTTEGFGNVSKGGRLNKDEVQQWFLASIPSIELAISSLFIKNSQGQLSCPQFPNFRASKGYKGGVSLINAMVALMLCPKADQRKRIVDALICTKPLSEKSEEYRKFVASCVVPTTSRPLGNDEVIQCLVALALGQDDPVGKLSEKTEEKGGKSVVIPAWRIAENRVSDSWDSGSKTESRNDQGEEFHETLTWCHKQIEKKLSKV